jgi:hypothetical protein
MRANFLFEDYKIKLDYVTKQYERLWRRFDFFLTVELALFGFLGYITFNARMPEATIFPALLGLAVSVLWYIAGAQDRWLVEVYRDRAKEAAVRFSQEPEGLPNYANDHAGAESPGGWKEVRSWYWPRLSMTRLPATVGIALLGVWLLIIVGWRPIAEKVARGRITPADATLQLSGNQPRLVCQCESQSK